MSIALGPTKIHNHVRIKPKAKKKGGLFPVTRRGLAEQCRVPLFLFLFLENVAIFQFLRFVIRIIIII